MKVFVAGATGAIGKSLVPRLVEGGHAVIAMTRSPQKADLLRKLGVESVVADPLDRDAVTKAMVRLKPEVVIHQLTALARAKSLKNFDDDFGITNRLRTEGTDNLLAAAQAAGVRRFVAQSYGNWNYARTGTGLKNEDDPLDPTPPAKQSKTLEAIRYLESAVVGADGIEGLLLRYANFYGPGTGLALDGNLVAMVRKRRLPVVGDGSGVWSFIHVDDAAVATITAMERGAPGAYNIVDDEPAPVAVWLPELARALGAPQPRRLPVWLARLVVGQVGISMMTQIRGTSNAKARRELGWSPLLTTWRESFHTGLADSAGTSAQRSRRVWRAGVP